MGNALTFIKRLTVRKARRFNVHNRAGRYIEKNKDKPQRAPLYEATMKEVEKLSKEMPDTTEELKKKDETLLHNLKNVYVTSEGKNKDNFSIARLDSSGDAKYLSMVTRYEKVDLQVPPGKISFDGTLTLLQDYERNPELNTHEALSTQYKLDLDTVKKITKHVKLLQFIPKKKKEHIGYWEKLAEDVVPTSFQGSKTELAILEEIMDESNRRVQMFHKKASLLDKGKQSDQKVIEDGVDHLISEGTQRKLDTIYMEVDIYQKHGTLPPEPKLIEEENPGKLQIPEGSVGSENKNLDEKNNPIENETRKNDSMEQQKVAKKT